MAIENGHLKSVKFGGTPNRDNPEPTCSGVISGSRCNDYSVRPTINRTRKTDTQGTHWQQWEVDIVTQFYENKFDGMSIFQLLPHRSKHSIRHKTQRLGFRYFRWDIIRTYDELTPTECAYIAGIVDGEGYIGIVRPKPYRQVCITVTNTNFEVLDWLKLKLGGGITNDKRTHGNRKPTRAWTMHRYGNCVNLLQKIYPYLIIKRKRVEEIV